MTFWQWLNDNPEQATQFFLLAFLVASLLVIVFGMGIEALTTTPCTPEGGN